jgi:hypothetical protein
MGDIKQWSSCHYRHRYRYRRRHRRSGPNGERKTKDVKSKWLVMITDGQEAGKRRVTVRSFVRSLVRS